MSQAIDLARRRAAQGFGFIDHGNEDDADWSDITPDIYEFPDDGGGASGAPPPPPWWVSATPIFTTIGATISDIWGNQYQHNPQTFRPLNTLPPNRNDGGRGGIGIGLDGKGIRLSDGTHIGWLPIAGVVFGFVLLQSKGLGRR